MKNTDLHTHSYYSDGKLSPTQLVRLAKEKGIKNLSLTDHNSFNGVQEAIEEGKRIGINIIPGVELRTKEGEVLGYFIDIKNKEFIKKVKIIQKRSKEVFENIIKELLKKGIDVKFNEVLDTKLKRNNVLTAYLFTFLKSKNQISIKEVKEIMKGDLFEPSYSTEEVIEMINDAGGVAVLAHPWYSKTFLDDVRMEAFVKAGLKGIEINNGGSSEEKTDSLDKINKFAEKYNLILTSGSDFHGDSPSSLMSTKHELGAINCDEKVVEQLKESLKN